MATTFHEDYGRAKFMWSLPLFENSGFDLEIRFRGLVEKELDGMLTLEAIDKIVVYSKRFPLHTVEDFCFGVLVGFILTDTIAIARQLYGRDATDEEMEETFVMIDRRTMEIRSKIRLTTGK